MYKANQPKRECISCKKLCEDIHQDGRCTYCYEKNFEAQSYLSDLRREYKRQKGGVK